MYVRGIYFGCVSDIFLLDFGTVLTVWYILAGVVFFYFYLCFVVRFI